MLTETVNIPPPSAWSRHDQPIAVADKFLVQGFDKYDHIYLAVGQTPIARGSSGSEDGPGPTDPIHTIAVFALTPDGVQDLLEMFTKVMARIGEKPEE